jgi:hypothetical protein
MPKKLRVGQRRVVLVAWAEPAYTEDSSCRMYTVLSPPGVEALPMVQQESALIVLRSQDREKAKAIKSNDVVVVQFTGAWTHEHFLFGRQPLWTLV